MNDRERIFRPTKGLNPHYSKEFLEVREGDPPDLDEFIDEVDGLLSAWHHDKLSLDEAMNDIERARHGEGGDE